MRLNVLSESCRLCEFYQPSGRYENQGICHRAEDPVFSVLASRTKCIFDKPGNQITEEHYQKNLEKEQRRYGEFLDTCRKASEQIAKWPEWKRKLLGK